MTTAPDRSRRRPAHDRTGARSTTITYKGDAIMTSRYQHTPGAYRATGADVADHLAAIGDHLATLVEVDARNGRRRYAAPTGELADRLDELTDAVLAVERLVVALRVDVEVGRLSGVPA
jgi:hypothetical protein